MKKDDADKLAIELTKIILSSSPEQIINRSNSIENHSIENRAERVAKFIHSLSASFQQNLD